ncbi:MAG: UvrD-helicase domain-containing protein [Chloroflexota bacterium]
MPLVKVSDLTKPQKSVVESVPRGTKYVEGPAGTGKTTIGVRRMLRLLTKDKIFANEILVLVPQRTLGLLYQSEAKDPKLDAGGRISVETMGSLSFDVVNLFFPLVADEFGFTSMQPRFLSLETAQYHMARVVSPFIEQKGYFDIVAIARNRLYSQIIDNLNKAALVGFPHVEVADRLIIAWGDKEQAQVTIYEQMQECVDAFRVYCLQNNLIDFSLQMEIFRTLWEKPPVREYLVNKYRHLIIDNIEEETPVAHDILLEWIPEAESALIIKDTDAGYRRFLGAAPVSAKRLSDLVTTNRDRFELSEEESFVTSGPLRAFAAGMGHGMSQQVSFAEPGVDPREVLDFDQPRFYTEMVDHVAERIGEMVHKNGVPPGEIVILSPFLSDSLRFALTERLETQKVPYRTHRPSRALREEAASQTMLTWAQMAHPEWNLPPTKFQVANALMETIEGFDAVRAQLAVNALYKNGTLQSFDGLASGLQDRITFTFGEKLRALHEWLVAYDTAPEDNIDMFWAKLFDERLSRVGYGFHNQPEYGTVAANLIDSARKFRQVMTEIDLGRPLSQEYVEMVRDGVIADQYLRSWNPQDGENAVLIAPAYTFLMSNRPVDYQFWLNVGSPGWWERLYQPLTHPFVLTREWDWELNEAKEWKDADEFDTRNETMFRLVLGLVRRCREGVYLGFSELGEQGYEQRGPLLGAIQAMLRRLQNEGEVA